jgi:hypothetical protein
LRCFRGTRGNPGSGITATLRCLVGKNQVEYMDLAIRVFGMGMHRKNGDS